MARTPLAHLLIKMFSTVAEPDRVPMSAMEHRAQLLGRREFLNRTGKIGLGAFAGGTLLTREGFAEPVNSDARIVVVGAGLAGLTCAYKLKTRGLTATVYEADTTLGGRCRTRRGFFDDGQLAERGGEFIDTGHTDLRHLAHQLGLHFDSVHQAEKPGTEAFYYFGGSRYSTSNAMADFHALLPKLKGDLRAADYPTLYNQSTPRGVELDQMSITDWINESVPGGIGSKFGQLLNVAYTIEYGAECSDQSALNLLYLLGYSHKDELQLFGPSDERFHLHGGNDRLVKRLAAELPGQIQTGMSFTAIALNADGTYALTFATAAGGSQTVTADRVVLALPFSILRARVDYSQAGFSALKQTAIAELGMGANTKLHVQFKSRHWRSLGGNGDSYSDTGYQNTWDGSRAQDGKAGLLVDYTGGLVGAGFNLGTPEDYAQRFLGQVEPVFPGLAEHWNGKATLEYWPGNPLTLGAYSYWKVGQYTRFAGNEGEAEGACHFAGEHTSIDFQGFLNGAVQSGKRAAREVYRALLAG